MKYVINNKYMNGGGQRQRVVLDAETNNAIQSTLAMLCSIVCKRQEMNYNITIRA